MPNTFVITGRLTRDPEARVTPKGHPVANFTIADSRPYTDGSGNKQEEQLFIDCTAIGKQAEIISKHFQKGKPIYATGRLKTDKWVTREGQNRSKEVMKIETFSFVPKDNTDDRPAASGGGSDYYPPQANTPDRPPAEDSGGAKSSGGDLIDEDDVPF